MTTVANQTKLFKERMIAIRKLLNALIQQCASPFTLAICGSAAFGQLTETSDVELLIVVDNQSIQSLLNTHLVRYHFQSFADETIAQKIAAEEVDAIRLPETEYCGFVFSINIYTEHLCRKIASLSRDQPVKFRNELKNETASFRGFANAKSGETSSFPIHSKPFKRGALSTSAIVTTSGGEPYFHIYVDKLLTAITIWDELAVQTLQTCLDRELHSTASNCGFENAYTFLYRYNDSNCDQRSRLQNRKSITEIESRISLNQGRLCQISGPSGVGKDTLIALLRANFPSIVSLVPYTTRSKRSTDNGHYHFVSEHDFCKMIIDDQFLFWHYDGDDASGRAKYYGLTRQSVEIAVMNSDRVLFSIGRSVAARFFKSRFPFSKTIYLYPESDEQLRQQLIRRGDEEQNELNFRLSNLGKHETYADSVFDHRLLNQPGNLYETMKIAASLIGVQGAE